MTVQAAKSSGFYVQAHTWGPHLWRGLRPQGLSGLLPRPLGNSHKDAGDENQPVLRTCFHPTGRWWLLVGDPGLVGVAGVGGFSLGSPSFLRPPPGQALVGYSWDCSGRLTSSHSSLLFFHTVIGTPRCPSLPFWRP